MKDLRGLTIIEVLIAISVIGVVFAALAALQLSNLRVTGAAGEDTDRLRTAVAAFEAQKRLVEDDYATYIECPGDPILCAPDHADDAVQIALRGRPTLNVGTSDLETDGLVEVDIIVTTDSGALRFRQFVSCLEATGLTPSVASVGDNCRPSDVPDPDEEVVVE